MTRNNNIALIVGLSQSRQYCNSLSTFSLKGNVEQCQTQKSMLKSILGSKSYVERNTDTRKSALKLNWPPTFFEARNTNTLPFHSLKSPLKIAKTPLCVVAIELSLYLLFAQWVDFHSEFFLTLPAWNLDSLYHRQRFYNATFSWKELDRLSVKVISFCWSLSTDKKQLSSSKSLCIYNIIN